MINTLLEHVPIKMEANDDEIATSESVVRDQNALDMAKDDDDVMETDSDDTDDVDDEDKDDDEEDTDLEIEQAATLLISSDEEAELEAQRIRFPEILVSRKSRKDSNKSPCSSRSSFSSNSSITAALTSKPLAQTKPNITDPKDSTEMQKRQQIISPHKTTESNSINSKNDNVVESVIKEDKNNTTTLLKSKMENNMKLENVNKTRNATEHVNKTHGTILSSPKSRRESNNSTCSVASTVASDTAETESCGNIYVFNLQQKLIFNCEFCDLKYGDLENFGRHLQKAHKLFNLDEDPEKENAPRNMCKTNKVSTNNCPNVKKEPLQILDSITTEAPSPPPPAPSVVLPLSVLAEPLDSCGNVFMLNHRKLFLVCGYCECKYANLDLFEKHLRQQHRIFEGCRNEVNVVPKIEVKEEVSIIADVNDTPDIITTQAMVAIPAHIPLDVSIIPENDQDTITASEEIADVDKTSKPDQIPEDNIVPTEEKLSEESENTSTHENCNAKNLIESSLPAENIQSKKRSSPEKSAMSTPKRPRRNIRNITKANEDAALLNEGIIQKATGIAKENIDEIPKIVSTSDVNETLEKTRIISKLNVTNEARKTRSSESKKSTQVDVIENKKSIKQKSKETKKINQTGSKEIVKPKELKKDKIDKSSKTIEKNSVETNKKKSVETKATKNKKLKENIKKESKEQTKDESKDIKKTNKETKKSVICKKSTIKRKSIATNNKKLQGDNPDTETVLEVTERRIESVKDNTATTSSDSSDETKKRRRTINAKIEKESTPPPSTITNPIPSPPAPQVKHVQVHPLHENSLRYDENLMHDLNTDPVNDIIEQIQNEYLQDDQSTQAKNPTANTLTFTIYTLQDTNSNLKGVVNNKIDENIAVSIKEPASDLNSPEDIKPLLIDNAKRFVCDQCPRSFKKHVRLVEHKRLHTGEKPFSCDECGKQFRIRMRLNEHKLRHSKDKKFKCEICQLACCTKQDLNLHMRHHTNDRRFQCSMCPKAFVRSSDLKIHVRVHTGEKPYVCDVCSKRFRANQNLSVHKKSHMGEASKTYKCEQCEKKFMRNIDRKVHMRSHTGEKPYKCEICQRGYSSKFNLRAHIQRDHISANGVGTPPRGKKKPGPKPKSHLKEELAKQKKLIEELQQQLLQQITTDEKIIPSEEQIPVSDTIQEPILKEIVYQETVWVHHPEVKRNLDLNPKLY